MTTTQVRISVLLAVVTGVLAIAWLATPFAGAQSSSTETSDSNTVTQSGSGSVTSDGVYSSTFNGQGGGNREQVRALMQERRQAMESMRGEREAVREQFRQARSEVERGMAGARAAMAEALEQFRQAREQIRTEYEGIRETWQAQMEEMMGNLSAEQQARLAEVREQFEQARAERFAARCEQIGENDTPASGFGAAHDFFSARRELMLHVRCDEASGDYSFEAGTGDDNEYIYKYGYRHDGDGWERFEFDTIDGEEVGSWIVGDAFVDIEADLEENGFDTEYLVAYICQRVDGQWKCGCSDQQCRTPRWQLQSVNPDDMPSSSEQS